MAVSEFAWCGGATRKGLARGAFSSFLSELFMVMMMVRIQAYIPGCAQDVEGSRHPLAMLSCGTPVEQVEKSNKSKSK
jgi:hypothetical protein